jgi:hypothetical protein
MKTPEYWKPRILEDWTPIKGASNYAISPQNYVYNLKTIKRMKRYWENLKDYSFVYDDEGKLRRVCHSNPTVERYSLPDEEMRVISDYPDYKVTDYGAVWKYRNTGKRYRGNPFLLGTTDIGDKEYIRISTEDGRRHWVRMEKIMEDTYPEY